MFGYIIINKDELKFKDFDTYRSYYCGLCQSLKQKHKSIGQLTLSYDMTFLAILLTDLYEPQTDLSSVRCVAHPLEKHPARTNKYTEYAADMNVLLSYYKCLDDWTDDKRKRSHMMAKLLQSRVDLIKKEYPNKAALIENILKELSEQEKQSETDIDHMAGLFGKIMAELFVYQEDGWAATLREMGFYLGKFVYLSDAYVDIEDDIKTGNFNPLLKLKNQPDFEKTCHEILTLMMAPCSKAFETLPLIEYADILRNILYSGVWSKYYLVIEKRKKAQENNQNEPI